MPITGSPPMPMTDNQRGVDGVVSGRVASHLVAAGRLREADVADVAEDHDDRIASFVRCASSSGGLGIARGDDGAHCCLPTMLTTTAGATAAATAAARERAVRTASSTQRDRAVRTACWVRATAIVGEWFRAPLSPIFPFSLSSSPCCGEHSTSPPTLPRGRSRFEPLSRCLSPAPHPRSSEHSLAMVDRAQHPSASTCCMC